MKNARKQFEFLRDAEFVFSGQHIVIKLSEIQTFQRLVSLNFETF
jgi:hypothetical protein